MFFDLLVLLGMVYRRRTAYSRRTAARQDTGAEEEVAGARSLTLGTLLQKIPVERDNSPDEGDDRSWRGPDGLGGPGNPFLAGKLVECAAVDLGDAGWVLDRYCPANCGDSNMHESYYIIAVKFVQRSVTLTRGPWLRLLPRDSTGACDYFTMSLRLMTYAGPTRPTNTR